MKVELFFRASGAQWLKFTVKHFASLEEIHDWLAASGLVIEEEYGDYARSPIGETTNRAIIWARKQ